MQWRSSEIAYCSNVHPGVSSEEIEFNIKRISANIAKDSTKKVTSNESMNLGLWLCEKAVSEYQKEEDISRLRNVLVKNNLYVSTLNGFPQGDFHQDIVKHKVYQPEWCDPSRLSFTKNLARFLAKILPKHCDEGTISTLPLAYRIGWVEDKNALAINQLLDYVVFAKRLFETSGKKIRLCLEMEPGCVLEKTDQVVDFFLQIHEAGVSRGQVTQEDIKRYLGLCYDICHQVVLREDIPQSLQKLSKANIAIGKVQISSALRVDALKGGGAEERLQALREFCEPKYLHQVTVEDISGTTSFYDDLEGMLSEVKADQFKNAFVHFHLPIQSSSVSGKQGLISGFSSTQGEIRKFFQSASELLMQPQLEIETYTWHVLPKYSGRLDDDGLVRGISEERMWLIETLRSLNLIASDK